MRQLDTRSLVISVLTVGTAILLWDASILYPLKLFVVLLHEISHGAAAVLTGGSIERLQLLAHEGGVAFTRGGNRFVILNAGYLGSALSGAFLLILSDAQPRLRKAALAIMGITLVGVAILFTRDLFTLAYVILAGGAILILAARAPTWWHRWVLYGIGTVSCLYAVVDIATDVLAGGPLTWLLGGGGANDAERLAELTWIPAFVWGLVWAGLSLAVYMVALLAVTRQAPRRATVRRNAVDDLLDEISQLP